MSACLILAQIPVIGTVLLYLLAALLLPVPYDRWRKSVTSD